MQDFSTPGAWGWSPDREAEFSPFYPSGMLPGRVIAQNHHFYTLASPQGTREARISGSFEYRCAGPADYPVLGDWVVFSPQEDSGGVIHSVMRRSSLLTRLAPGSSGALQPLGANLDRGIIVMALDQDYSPARADRFLTLLKEAGAQALVWLNKSDLYPEKAQTAQRELTLRWPEVPVVAGSALGHNGETRGLLEPWLISGETLCLLGSSGAGKSTLINALAEKELRATGAVRASDGKGRHTSVDRVLIALENGTCLMDHPGLREVGLWAGEETLDDVFEPIATLSRECRFRDCSHSGEPGCRVLQALEAGELDPNLWASYQRQSSELAHLARKTDPDLQRQERDKWKSIGKSIRSFSKEKRSSGKF